MKPIVLTLLLVMSFSVKTMDDQKPFYPDPEISFPDPDVPYPDSSTTDNRDKTVITIDEEDWKRINALIDALDKSEPVRVALSQLQLFQRWEGKTPASRKTKLDFDCHTLNSIPKAGSYLITPPLRKEITVPINLVVAQTCGVSTSDRPMITQFARTKLDESELQLADSNEDVGQLIDGHGCVIGINTAGIAAAQTVNYRIPYGDGQWDSEDACNTSEVIEGCGVNFDPQRKQIIASFWRQ